MMEGARYRMQDSTPILAFPLVMGKEEKRKSGIASLRSQRQIIMIRGKMPLLQTSFDPSTAHFVCAQDRLLLRTNGEGFITGLSGRGTVGSYTGAGSAPQDERVRKEILKQVQND